jgi:hypothetical protein
MAAHIDTSGRLIDDRERTLALTCPRCQVLAHLTPLAVPTFADLQAHRPKHVGLVYRCDACNEPVFLRYAVRMYAASRIELSPQIIEVERATEKFSFTYLPEEVEALFREALACFTAGALNAFASMCRRTAQAAFADLGETGRFRLFGELNAMRDMAEIDSDSFGVLRGVIFENGPEVPLLDEYQAGLLLEAMKDLLYEAYIRKGKLQQAMTVRRFFVEESASTVSLITKATS